MSIFDTPNGDAYTLPAEQAARGPRLGFQDAFDAAWEVQARTSSLLGVQKSFRDIEQRQIKKMRDAGITPPDSLDDNETGGSGPFGMAQFRQGRYDAVAQSIADGGGWYTDEMVKDRDEKLKKLQQEHPELGIKTYGEMFKDVQAEGQEALKRASLPTTFGGTIGGFAGAMVGGLDPRTDPLSVASFIATLPLGGGTVIARAGAQGAAQAVTEAANIGLGVDAKGIVTGTPTTTGEELGRIGMAAAGGVGGQLIGEGAAAGVRRLATGKWFADVPPGAIPTRQIPSPDDLTRSILGDLENGVQRRMPPDRPFRDYPDFETFARSQGYDLANPYGPSRQAALRNAVDIDYVGRELNRWDGPQAHAVAARAETALPEGGKGGVRYDDVYQRYVDGIDDVDTIARRLDPDIFRLYDKLEAQRAEMRAAINTEAERFRTFQGADTLFEGAAEQQRVREIEARAELQKVDAQMRDLAPLVSRAYAAAEKEWRAGAANDFAVQRFLKGVEDRSGWRARGDGQPSLTEQPPKIAPALAPLAVRNIADAVPLSVLTNEQQAKLRPGQHDAADRVAVAVKDSLDVADRNVDTFMGDVRKVVKMDAQELQAAQKTATDKLAAAQQALATEAKKTPSTTGFIEAFDSLKGGGVSEDFYKRAFAAYEKGSTRVAGIAEPLLRKARAEGTTFASWQDVKKLYEGDIREAPTGGDTAAEAVKKAQQEVDALTGITMPDGQRLDFKDVMIDADGNKTTVRQFLQEMDKDVDALSAVRTCSLPS